MKNKKYFPILLALMFLVLFVGMLFLSKTIFWMFGTDVNSFNIRALTGFGSLMITWFLFSISF
ncbi:hypothetical protein DDT56_22600 [Brenneria corticis]|uniref:Uncharacterized protein n=1 Tax=Brenneria corticis TaxID=2173106 RepID=A0A2U1TL61_9GAMM|nr:hypothetical protein DDT56_22600 [Brenneria sp. CFCC 11842]